MNPWAMRGAVVMITFSQPRSIISQINRPILATLMAPEKVLTTAHSGFRNHLGQDLGGSLPRLVAAEGGLAHGG